MLQDVRVILRCFGMLDLQCIQLFGQNVMGIFDMPELLLRKSQLYTSVESLALQLLQFQSSFIPAYVPSSQDLLPAHSSSSPPVHRWQRTLEQPLHPSSGPSAKDSK